MTEFFWSWLAVLPCLLKPWGISLVLDPWLKRSARLTTIGGFEAHGLAIIIGILLIRAATLASRRLWHALGLSVHLLLGSANVLFWSSFLKQGLLAVGIVTTALHATFVVAQAICLRRAVGRL